MDFSKEQLLRRTKEDQPEIDKLTLADPRIIERYNDRSWKKICTQELNKQIKELERINEADFTAQHQESYDSLVKEITKIRKQVKSGLRHIYRGNIQWSPQLAEALLNLKTWQYIVRFKTRPMGSKIKQSYISRLTKLNRTPQVLTSSLLTAKHQLKIASLRYRQVKTNASEYRESHKEWLDKE